MRARRESWRVMSIALRWATRTSQGPTLPDIPAVRSHRGLLLPVQKEDSSAIPSKVLNSLESKTTGSR